MVQELASSQEQFAPALLKTQAMLSAQVSWGVRGQSLGTTMERLSTVTCTRVGLARTIYMGCVCGIFGREITKYTVIYGVHIYGSGQPYTYLLCARRFLAVIVSIITPFSHLLHHPNTFCVHAASWLFLLPCAHHLHTYFITQQTFFVCTPLPG